MAMAGLGVARQQNHSFIYFQTEGNQSRLLSYRFLEDQITLLETLNLPETVTLDDHLRIHLGNYESGDPKHPLERAVAEALRSDPRIAEVLTSVRPQGLGALEVDFAVRCGNQIGIGEVKSKGAKDGIDQINAVAHPRYLGTYVGKFLVSGETIHPNNKELAHAYHVETIELPGVGNNWVLPLADKERLVEGIVRRLSPAS